MNESDSRQASSPPPVIFIGTSGWTYNHWKGIFYPHNLPQKSWFHYYASRFSAVEVNATFYRTFKDQTYQNWRERAPQGFGYVLKAPKLITHRKYLVDVAEEVEAFYRSCTLLQEKFEMILLQVAPQTPYDLDRLHNSLRSFPDPGKVAVEFRHSQWLNTDVFDLLRAIGATLCLVDSPQQKPTDSLTSDRAYLRMHGRKHWYTYDYSQEELREIAGLVQDLVKKGARRVYIFFNNDFEGHAPANAAFLQSLLNDLFK